MAYKFLAVFALIIVATNFPQETVGNISDEEKQKISDGLDAGQAIAEALKDGDFPKTLVKLGKNLTPFLSALGPLASIALSFIPTGDSPEMKFMKKKFAEVNNKLDIIISEFGKLKDLINWNAVSVGYGGYELKIDAAASNLKKIYKVQGKAREEEKSFFIQQFESNFDNSLETLYNGITKKNSVLKKNIIKAVVKKTENHKRKFEQFALGFIQLLLKGINVKISYHAMINQKRKSKRLAKEWSRKILSLKDRFLRLSNKIKGRYLEQLDKDVKYIIRYDHELDNEKLMLKLYHFVTDKYDWRYWFVAVYDDITGNDVHSFCRCYGRDYHQFNDKNFVFASQDKGYSRFEMKGATDVLSSVDEDITNCELRLRSVDERAKSLKDYIKDKTSQLHCSPSNKYQLIMIVHVERGLFYKAEPGHIANHTIERQNICVWEDPQKRAFTVPAHIVTNAENWYFTMLLFG